VRRAEAALLAGYGLVDGSRRRRAHVWASVQLVTVVGHRVPLSDPRWAERTTALLDSARLFLDGSLQKEEGFVAQSPYGKLRLDRQGEGKWLQGNADP
jgi:hypothetical protein